MTKRINTFLSLVALAASCAFAPFAQASPIPLKWNEKASELKSQAKSQQPSKAPTIDANGAVIAPEGVKLDFSQSYYMVDAFGISAVGGEKAEIYYDEESATVYIKKLFEDYMGDCYYAKGSLIEGDLQNGVVEFSIDAPIYYCYGTLLYVGIAEINDAYDGFNFLEDRKSFQFIIDNGEWTCPDCLALIDKNDIDGGAYWIQYDYRYIPINLDEMTPVTAPASAVPSHYFCANDGTDIGIVKISRDGDDFYFNNVFGYNYTFKGSLNADGQIELEMPQLVSADGYFIYLNASDTSGRPLSKSKVCFDYDAKTGDIYNPTNLLALFSGNRFLYGSTIYGDLEFVKFLDDEEPIEVPAGVEQQRYYMTTGYDLQGNHKGGLVKVAKDGNNIYFLKADLTNYDVIMMGILNPDDNTVTVDLNQIVGVQGSRFLGVAAAKQYIVEVEDPYDDPYNEIRYTIDEDKAVITMQYDPSTQTYYCNDDFAIIDAQRRLLSKSFIAPTFYPVNDPYSIPASATIGEYVCTPDGEANNAKVVKIARHGDDFYFIHESDRVFYGHLTDDGKVSVAIPQVIGFGSNEQGVFLRVGSSQRVYTPEDVDLQMRSWKIWNDEEGVDEIIFDFDEALNHFGFEGHFSFVTMNNCYELESGTNVAYDTYLKGLFTPANPTDLELADKKEDYWGNQERYCFSFVIPCKDVDGRYLPYDNISYSIYFDDEIFTFTPEEYPKTFTVDVTEVPFNHPATGEITAAIWNSNMRRVYLYNLPKKQLGVRSIYTYQGEKQMSDIVYMDVSALGVDAPLANSVPVEVQYFNLAGCRVVNPGYGFFIRKTIYSNGTSSSDKIFVKDHKSPNL